MKTFQDIMVEIQDGINDSMEKNSPDLYLVFSADLSSAGIVVYAKDKEETIDSIERFVDVRQSKNAGYQIAVMFGNNPKKQNGEMLPAMDCQCEDYHDVGVKIHTYLTTGVRPSVTYMH
jgi:hypothetical protein